MAQLSIKAGTTGYRHRVVVKDATSTTDGGLTGLVFGAGGLVAWYFRTGDTAPTTITLANIVTLGTWVSGGLKLVDDTKMPGLIEFDLPNAALVAGAQSLVVFLFGAANMLPVRLEIELTGPDNQDAAAFGLASLATDLTDDVAEIATLGTINTSIGSGLGTAVTALAAAVTAVKAVTDAVANGNLLATVQASPAPSTTSFAVAITRAGSPVAAVGLNVLKGRWAIMDGNITAADGLAEGAVVSNTASGTNITTITLTTATALPAAPAANDTLSLTGAGSN